MKTTCQTLVIERKTFVIETGQNHVGPYVRITETVKGHSHRNTIILPATGATELGTAILAASKSTQEE